MQIGIISDAHIGNKYAIKSDMYADIVQNKFKDCDFIVDCGDFTDKSFLTAPQIDSISKIFKSINKDVYLVSGNHDSLSETTTVSLFESKSNIHIIKNKPQILDNMLFIPYVDDAKELVSDLNALVKNSVELAFTHLNLTTSFYSLFPNDIQALNKYSECIFNGHIHTPEYFNNLYGRLYNVGSCSSLTYGDEHIPNYCIYNTQTKKLIKYTIAGSIAHKTFNEDLNIEQIVKIIQQYIDEDNTLRLCCRFKLPNDSLSIEKRKNIVDTLNKCFKPFSLSFDYVNKKQNQNVKTIKENKKMSLVEQLVEQFEADNKMSLSDFIKRSLL